jgi:hypothetical protein
MLRIDLDEETFVSSDVLIESTPGPVRRATRGHAGIGVISARSYLECSLSEFQFWTEWHRRRGALHLGIAVDSGHQVIGASGEGIARHLADHRVE